MSYAIEIRGLAKSFGEIRAVQDISFSVESGSLFAFLGVNGAGKSTTISMMCGQLSSDAGEIFIDGCALSEDPDRIKRSIGIVFQHSVLDRTLSVYDNLLYRAALYGIGGKEFEGRLAELSELLDLGALLKRPYGKLSGGQRRKIDIARALLHKPSILILDEPTTGLDPQTRRTVWQVVSHLQKTEGMTVFLTTHYMEEAADADFVVILDSGKIVAQGTPLELKNRFTGDFITLYGADEEKISRLSLPFEKTGDVIKLKVENTAAATKLIVENPELFDDYEITKGRMDDVFLSATGKKLRADDSADEKGGDRVL